MSGDAEVRFAGNLIGPPELRFTSSGTAVASFTVAVNSRVKDAATNTWSDGPTTFFRCSAWKQLGENVAASLKRGDSVIVSGTIASREYDKDGEKRYAWEVRAAEVGASLQFATVEAQRATRTQLKAVAGGDAWAGLSEEPPV